MVDGFPGVSVARTSTLRPKVYAELSSRGMQAQDVNRKDEYEEQRDEVV